MNQGYKSGGNDYLKKPFSLEELFLRVDELLTRTVTNDLTNEREYLIGKYIFIPHNQVLHYQDEEIKLSNRESSLLLLLYSHKNALLERKSALMILWGDDSYLNTRTMDVFITKLRKHLSKDHAN